MKARSVCPAKYTYTQRDSLLIALRNYAGKGHCSVDVANYVAKALPDVKKGSDPISPRLYLRVRDALREKMPDCVDMVMMVCHSVWGRQLPALTMETVKNIGRLGAAVHKCIEGLPDDAFPDPLLLSDAELELEIDDRLLCEAPADHVPCFEFEIDPLADAGSAEEGSPDSPPGVGPNRKRATSAPRRSMTHAKRVQAKMSSIQKKYRKRVSNKAFLNNYALYRILEQLDHQAPCLVSYMSDSTVLIHNIVWLSVAEELGFPPGK